MFSSILAGLSLFYAFEILLYPLIESYSWITISSSGILSP